MLTSFLQKPGLAFADVLPEERIQPAFDEENVAYAQEDDEVYTPPVTLAENVGQAQIGLTDTAIDREGQSFNDPAARDALFQAIRHRRGQVEIQELDCHINDVAFAEAAAKKLLELML